MNLNLDYDLLQKQQLLIAEMIHDQHDVFRINREQRGLLEGIWELLVTVAQKPEPAANRPHLLVYVEGGCVQGVSSDLPADVTLVDYDTDGGDDDRIMKIPQGDSPAEEAFVCEMNVETGQPFHAEVLRSIEQQRKEKS